MRRENFNSLSDKYKICVHIFYKVYFPCSTNLALKRTSIDNKIEFILRLIKTVPEHLFMDDSLDSFPSLEEIIRVTDEVIKLLKLGGFSLTKFVSNKLVIGNYISQQLAPGKDLVILDLDETA